MFLVYADIKGANATWSQWSGPANLKLHHLFLLQKPALSDLITVSDSNE